MPAAKTSVATKGVIATQRSCEIAVMTVIGPRVTKHRLPTGPTLRRCNTGRRRDETTRVGPIGRKAEGRIIPLVRCRRPALVVRGCPLVNQLSVTQWFDNARLRTLQPLLGRLWAGDFRLTQRLTAGRACSGFIACCVRCRSPLLGNDRFGCKRRRLCGQLLAGQCHFGLEDQRAGDVLLFWSAPRQAITGRNWMETRIGCVPLDLKC